ncbi:hypothetical protein SNEBB_009296 [Seison nebaliae]|nr:hypothetical protein SNEBB_009296 [Seison nebaliae]
MTSQNLDNKSKNIENLVEFWNIHADSAIAYKLQNEEFDKHFKNNKYQRKIVKNDKNVAIKVERDVHQKERQILNKETSRKRLQELRDNQVAEQMQNEEMRKFMKGKNKRKF